MPRQRFTLLKHTWCSGKIPFWSGAGVNSDCTFLTLAAHIEVKTKINSCTICRPSFFKFSPTLEPLDSVDLGVSDNTTGSS